MCNCFTSYPLLRRGGREVLDWVVSYPSAALATGSNEVVAVAGN
jgi:hypothetical protein